MTATINGTPTNTYALLHSASADGTVSLGPHKLDVEVLNHTSGSTPPAATLRGHPIRHNTSEAVPVKSGDHLWWRIRDVSMVGSADDTPIAAITVQTN